MLPVMNVPYLKPLPPKYELKVKNAADGYVAKVVHGPKSRPDYVGRVEVAVFAATEADAVNEAMDAFWRYPG